MRVPESENVLDHTAVHPESYPAAAKLLELCGYQLSQVGQLEDLDQRLEQLGPKKAAEECGVGLPTLRDIAAELQKPGRDPRDQLPPPLLRTDVMELSDLKPGMQLTGTVRNVVDFGAFVDIGVHQDGLVHISQLAGPPGAPPLRRGGGGGRGGGHRAFGGRGQKAHLPHHAEAVRNL